MCDVSKPDAPTIEPPAPPPPPEKQKEPKYGKKSKNRKESSDSVMSRLQIPLTHKKGGGNSKSGVGI